MIWFTVLNVPKKVVMIIMPSRRISKRVIDNSGRDKNSYILKHQIEKQHPCPQYEIFKNKIFGSGFRNNTKKRKLSEALWINTLRPSLNK